MNKLVKASIAGAAGFALLLGGAGTLAAWNTSTTVYAGTISAGSMKISQPTNVANDGWFSVVGGISTPIDINNFSVIPGDTLTYTKTLTVKATGNNLHARLAIDPTSIPTQGGTSADNALGSLVLQALLTNSSQVFTVTHDGSFTFDPSTLTFTIDAGQGFNHNITLSATFTIPNGGPGAENAAMGGHVNLNGLKVTLTQI